MTLREVRMLVSLSCDEASRLASAAFDGELSRNERWALRLHTLVCRNCHRLVKQLRSMRALLAQMPASSQQHLRGKMPQLSADRKEQIKRLLLDARQTDQS